MSTRRLFSNLLGKIPKTLDELIAAQFPQVWIVADDLVGANNSRISALADRVGNAYINGSMSSQPRLITSYWPNHQAIQFGYGGAGTYLLCPNTYPVINGDFTLFVVCQQTSYNIQGLQYLFCDYNNGLLTDGKDIASTIALFDNIDGGNKIMSSNYAIATNKVVLMADNTSISVNGEAIALTASPHLGNFSGRYFGSSPYGIAQYRFNGYVTEVILMHGTINDEKRLIGKLLKAKYSV